MLIAFDTETALIQPGRLAPPLVCLSWYSEESAGLCNHQEAIGWMREALRGPAVLIGQNVAFDFGVLASAAPELLPHIFQAYEDNRVTDTMIRAKLLAIADGTLKAKSGKPKKGEFSAFSLAGLARDLLGRTLDKDTWRLRYAELRDVPIEQWPDGAKQYAQEDARTTYDVYQAQGTAPTLADEFHQARAAFSLHLMSMWGLRTNGEWVARLKEWLGYEHAAFLEACKSEGVVRADGTKDMGALRIRVREAYAALDQEPPVTGTGQPKTDADTLKQSGDDFLIEMADGGKASKVLTTFIPALERGTKVPINPRFNVLVDTGRTSCADPNLQNMPSGAGVRECFHPRPGYVYVAADYSTLELCTLAQTLLDQIGHSRMADALREGKDLHVLFASRLAGLDYEEALARYEAGDATMKRLRRIAKGPNFGLPGGMGVDKLILYCRGMGIKIPRESYDDPATGERVWGAKELKEMWLEAFPEVREYFNWISNQVGQIGDGVLQCGARTSRIRGGLYFTEACNTLFQSPAADGAKEALWRVTKECFLDENSSLYGSRPVNFVHDEIMLETPEERASEAAERLALLMVYGMKRFVPDIPIKAEPVVMAYWSKDAKSKRGPDGRLITWRGLLG